MCYIEGLLVLESILCSLNPASQYEPKIGPMELRGFTRTYCNEKNRPIGGTWLLDTSYSSMRLFSKMLEYPMAIAVQVSCVSIIPNTAKCTRPLTELSLPKESTALAPPCVASIVSLTSELPVPSGQTSDESLMSAE